MSQAKSLEQETEVDLWWGAYAGRTMAPALFCCALTTMAIALAVRLIWRDGFADPRLTWHLTLAVNGVVWLPALLLWAYRTLTLSYRLTTRRLYRDIGFAHVADGAVDLPEVREVAIVHSKVERFLGVGRLDVYRYNEAQPFALRGIHDPDWVAGLIRNAARRAREAEAKPRQDDKLVAD